MLDLEVSESLSSDVIKSCGTARTPSSDASCDSASMNDNRTIGLETSHLACDLSDARGVTCGKVDLTKSLM